MSSSHEILYFDILNEVGLLMQLVWFVVLWIMLCITLESRILRSKASTIVISLEIQVLVTNFKLVTYSKYRLKLNFISRFSQLVMVAKSGRDLNLLLCIKAIHRAQIEDFSSKHNPYNIIKNFNEALQL